MLVTIQRYLKISNVNWQLYVQQLSLREILSGILSFTCIARSSQKIHLHCFSRMVYGNPNALFFLAGGAGGRIGSRTGGTGGACGLGSRAGIGGFGESSAESEIINMNYIHVLIKIKYSDF